MPKRTIDLVADLILARRRRLGTRWRKVAPGVLRRRGQHIPLLIDVRNLSIFDERGERVSPDPTQVPEL